MGWPPAAGLACASQASESVHTPRKAPGSPGLCRPVRCALCTLGRFTSTDRHADHRADACRDEMDLSLADGCADFVMRCAAPGSPGTSLGVSATIMPGRR